MLTTLEFELLKTLTELDGIASYEDEIRDYLKSAYQKMGYQLVHDNLGSIFAYKPSKTPNSPIVLIDGHMDEVGFLLNRFNDDGSVGVVPIGGMSLEDILEATYRVKTKDKREYIGTITNRSEAKEIIDVNIDFGFLNIDEAKEAGLEYGDMITFVSPFKDLANGLYACKAIDNRYSLALGIEILEYFKDKELPFDLYVGGSVQEEVGLRSASAVVNLIKPDFAIVLDCSRAVADPKKLGHVDEGVLLRFFDPSMVAFKELIELQKEACIKSGARYQYFSTTGGTNAGMIHKSGTGVLTLNHCICARNIHTPVSIFSGEDYHDAKKSLIYLLEHFNQEVLIELGNKRR